MIVLLATLWLPHAGASHGVSTYTDSGTILAESGWTELNPYPTFPVPADASKVIVRLDWTSTVPTHLDAGVETDWTPCYNGGSYWITSGIIPRCVLGWQAGSSDPGVGWYVDDAALSPATSGTSEVTVPGSHIAAFSTCTTVCDWTAVARARLPAAVVDYTFTIEVHH